MECLQSRRPLTLADLEKASRRVTEAQLSRIVPAHADEQHRTCLGTASDQGLRLYFLFQRRERLFRRCSPKNSKRRERLWAEMMRLKILINAVLSEEIRAYGNYPPDRVFIDSNREVYVVDAPWTPVAHGHIGQGDWPLDPGPRPMPAQPLSA